MSIAERSSRCAHATSTAEHAQRSTRAHSAIGWIYFFHGHNCPLPFFVPLIGQVSLTSPYTLLELWRITKVSAPTLSHGLLETHLSHQISGPSQTPLECALVAVFDIDSRGLHYHSTVTLTAMEMLATGSGRGVRMPSQDRMYYWLDNPSKDGIYHGPSP